MFLNFLMLTITDHYEHYSTTRRKKYLFTNILSGMVVLSILCQ